MTKFDSCRLPGFHPSTKRLLFLTRTLLTGRLNKLCKTPMSKNIYINKGNCLLISK